MSVGLWVMKLSHQIDRLKRWWKGTADQWDGTEIVAGLWLSGYIPREWPKLPIPGVPHDGPFVGGLVCVAAEDHPPPCPPKCVSAHVPLLDLPVEDFSPPRLQALVDLVKVTRVLGGNGTVCVQCDAGDNRSATIVIALLVEESGASVDSVIAYVREKRPTLGPHEWQIAVLYKFAEWLKSGSKSNGGR